MLETNEINRFGGLDKNMRLIVTQFSCSNKNIMPVSLKWLKCENMRQAEKRLQKVDYGDGRLFMDTEVNTVSVYDFLGDLDKANYEIVDAFCQERLTDNLKLFYMARFVFCRKEYVEISEEFINKSIVRAEFLKMAMTATWRVKGYVNPFYKNDEQVLGQHTMNVNMVARNPLVDETGHLLYRWERDERGEKIGDAKILVKPKYYLRIENNCVVIN